MKAEEESEKAGLKLSIQPTKIMASSPIATATTKSLQSCPTLCNPIPGQSHYFMANRWGNNGNSDRLYFLGHQNHCGQQLKP